MTLCILCERSPTDHCNQPQRNACLPLSVLQPSCSTRCFSVLAGPLFCSDVFSGLPTKQSHFWTAPRLKKKKSFKIAERTPRDVIQNGTLFSFLFFVKLSDVPIIHTRATTKFCTFFGTISNFTILRQKFLLRKINQNLIHSTVQSEINPTTVIISLIRCEVLVSFLTRINNYTPAHLRSSHLDRGCNMQLLNCANLRREEWTPPIPTHKETSRLQGLARLFDRVSQCHRPVLTTFVGRCGREGGGLACETAFLPCFDEQILAPFGLDLWFHASSGPIPKVGTKIKFDRDLDLDLYIQT